MKVSVKKLVFAALCLALCIVLAFLTGQIPQIGGMLSPMHIPVLLCGFLCGWPYALAVGLVAPLLRHLMFGMPPILTALVSRAAMDGGLAVNTAKEMELSYIREAEACGTITELKTVMNQMLDDFVHKVRECNANPLISRTIQESCDYIRANVLKPLTVEEIAKEMGYTTYYFTKKFYKEMGVKVTDYIKEARVHYAKIALLTTRKSIEEISESLHFGSRNYFSKVFRSIVGVTPAAYRENVGKELKES